MYNLTMPIYRFYLPVRYMDDETDTLHFVRMEIFPAVSSLEVLQTRSICDP